MNWKSFTTYEVFKMALVTASLKFANEQEKAWEKMPRLDETKDQTL